MVKNYKAIATTLGLSILVVTMPARAHPDLRFSHLQLNMSQEECLKKAYNLLKREGFQNLRQTNNSSSNGYVYAVGYLRNNKAIVDCSIIYSGKTQAIIMVASESEGDTSEASKLTGRLYNALSRSSSSRDISSGNTMSDETFARFIQALKDSWPHQIEFLSQPARDGYFTAEQVRQIIEVFSFPKQQEDAAVVLYPSVVDKANWFVVYEAFSFNSSIDAVRRRIEPK